MKRNLFNFFKQLSAVSFRAQSLANSAMNWNCRYHGSCEVKIRGNAICMTDYLTAKNGQIITDQKVWKIIDDKLEFWHYRLGSFQHIFTFSLPSLIQHKNYICDQDCYSSTLEITDDCLILTIRICSSRKNEQIIYTYS